MNAFFAIFPIIFFIIFFSILFISIVSLIKMSKETNRTIKRVNNQYKDFVIKNNPTYNTSSDHNATHESQQSYSYAYARKDSSSHDIKDKPLSEAERNVLYGK